jgi:DUF2934 family protein
MMKAHMAKLHRTTGLHPRAVVFQDAFVNLQNGFIGQPSVFRGRRIGPLAGGQRDQGLGLVPMVGRLIFIKDVQARLLQQQLESFMQDLEQTIRERAYHLWIADGCRDGHAEAHWLNAQRDIVAMSLRSFARATIDAPPAAKKAERREIRKPVGKGKRRVAGSAALR